jgi:hypothetical protein
MPKLRAIIVTSAAIGAAAVGGGAIASAATSSTSTSSSSSAPPAAAPGAPYGAPSGAPAFNPSKGGHTVGGRTETLLTGSVAAKVRAAALKKVSGTVERVETNVDDSAPYEAHIVKPDGTQVIVEVNRDFTVHAVETMGGHP